MMRVRHTVLLLAIAALCATATGQAQASGSRLRVEVWPTVSTAPATVRVRAIVEPNAENRGLLVAADSGEFFRSSFTPMSGLDAATVTETTLKNLPGGEYEISVALEEAQGKHIIERRTVRVTSTTPN